jgi:tetratricopeptide (TPR) repeat protein
MWLRRAASVFCYDLAPLGTASTATCHYDAAQDLLTQATFAAGEADSPEQHALTQQSRAFLAEARKQWDVAETEHLAFLAWAEANWGPHKRGKVLLDLARVSREQGDLQRASDHAERARREVEIDPPEYRNRFTAIAVHRELARIRKAQGDLPLAHAALEAAIAVAQGDGLRLREWEILIDLAKLPPLPGGPDQRIDHAQRARAIAQDAAFPVDEAEATLVLAGIHLQAGQGRRAQALFDQVAWIVDRNGPRALRERAAKLRTELGG